MSYKETRELAQLPAEIEALEQQQHELTARMSSGDYHKQGASQIKADCSSLTSWSASSRRSLRAGKRSKRRRLSL
jgi:hypothetical protein